MSTTDLDPSVGASEGASADRAQLSNQLSDLCGLLVLSRMLFDHSDEAAIVSLAASAAAALGGCSVVAGLLERGGEYAALSADPDLDIEDLTAQASAGRGAERPLHIADRAWAKAFALGDPRRPRGFLLLSAARNPTTDELFLVKTLSQQTSAALTNAGLRRVEQDRSAELRRLNAQIAAGNDELRQTVAELRQQKLVHEVLSRVAASGAGEQGVAEGLHRLTRLGVVIQDRFGNPRAWSGTDRPEPLQSTSSGALETILRRGVKAKGPTRHRGQLVMVPQVRGEPLGLLALIDPDGTAGEFEAFALEYACTVLSAELGHQRSLAEAEVRLTRDLVEDLLAGTGSESLVARGEALGHDLRSSLQVMIVTWQGDATHDSVVRSLHRAVDADGDCLVARRAESIVAVAPARSSWEHLYESVAGFLDSGDVAIGVGGISEEAAQVPHSYDQAKRALAVRRHSRTPTGITTFADLGVYRILAGAENTPELDALIHEWLGLLLDYDEQHNTELVRTLAVYLECGGNYDTTAETLIIHRSTLRYRLQRIREVSGRDLNEVDTRFNLQVATRAWKLLDG
jgi:hypothetical protein